jgi:outer membrane protein assembly factor BamB
LILKLRNRTRHADEANLAFLADGKIYCVSEDGTTTVVKAGPAFEILGVNKLESLTLASPVAVDNQIFIRTADYLYCIQKK